MTDEMTADLDGMELEAAAGGEEEEEEIRDDADLVFDKHTGMHGHVISSRTNLINS